MRIAVGVVGLAAVAVSVWRLGGTWGMVPFVLLAAVGAVLAGIDLTTRRLPNRIVLPAIGASIALLLGSALLDRQFERWSHALVGGAALFALYLVLALVSPQGMGMGDVKLAALVGLFGGYLGLEGWITGAFAGFMLGAIVALVSIVLRRSGLKTHLPFGPWMLAGVYVALVVSR